jgi:hypothetical protein
MVESSGAAVRTCVLKIVSGDRGREGDSSKYLSMNLAELLLGAPAEYQKVYD